MVTTLKQIINKITVMSKYLIDGTTNMDKEQNSGPYLDDKFWPNWDRDLKNFKDVLIKHEPRRHPI